MGVRPCDDGDGISPSKAAFHSTPFFVPPDDVFSRLSSPRVNVTTDHRGEDDSDLDVGLGYSQILRTGIA